MHSIARKKNKDTLYLHALLQSSAARQRHISVAMFLGQSSRPAEQTSRHVQLSVGNNATQHETAVDRRPSSQLSSNRPTPSSSPSVLQSL